MRVRKVVERDYSVFKVFLGAIYVLDFIFRYNIINSNHIIYFIKIPSTPVLQRVPPFFVSTHIENENGKFL